MSSVATQSDKPKTASASSCSKCAVQRAEVEADTAGVPRFMQLPGSRDSVPVGSADDPLEREADAVAAHVHAPGQTCPACAKAKAKSQAAASAPQVQRAASAGASAGRQSSPFTHTLAKTQSRAAPPIAAQVSAATGADLSGVSVHSGEQAAALNTALNARAFTLGQDIFLGAGESADDSRLMAHELAHVAQQQRGEPVIQRQVPGGGDAAAGDPAPVNSLPAVPAPLATGLAAAADRAALAAGPCGVMAEALSNSGLLWQLNRARVYLNDTARGDGEWYDYANLLRRLVAVRRQRIAAGQVWLAERGLLTPPPMLYSLAPGGMNRLAVSRVAGDSLGGAFVGGGMVLSAAQFQRFLENQHVTELDLNSYFMMFAPDASASVGIDLPARRSTRLASPWALPNASPAGPLFVRTDTPAWPGLGGGGNPFAVSPFAPPVLSPLMPPPTGPVSPLMPFAGWNNGGPPPGAADNLLWPRMEHYDVPMSERLSDLSAMPGSVTAEGNERLYRPAPAASGAGPWLPGSDFADVTDRSGLGPSGIGSRGAGGGFWSGLPVGSSGLMWEGSHVSNFVMPSDMMIAGGFRSTLWTHGRGPVVNPGLNAGTPGTYANDALFRYMGAFNGLPGFNTSHWGSRGTIAYVRTDGTPASAIDILRMMGESMGRTEGRTYRYSTPPRTDRHGRPLEAWRVADEFARANGIANWESLGGNNCINEPAPIHDATLNGLPMEITAADGMPISLLDPHHASARNMSEFMTSVPDHVLAAHGLQRVNLSARAWGSAGFSGLLGAGMSVGTDAWRASNGENVHYMRDAGVSFVSGSTSAIAEDLTTSALTASLLRRGVNPGMAAGAGRFGAATGVGALAAPLTTWTEMALSDEDFTFIDYSARGGRSAVSGAGGAAMGWLGAAGVGALAGSEVPLLGNAVGFVVGAGGYFLTDWLVGDEVEEGIRDSMGEQGCTGGVGPGR